MPEYPQEGVLRGGHIPGAKSVPWARAANTDGTFKSADELRAIYEKEIGLKKDDDVIAYCRIGERSSHTWFVLTYLLGYRQGAELRRQLDGVGQLGAPPNREMSDSATGGSEATAAHRSRCGRATRSSTRASPAAPCRASMGTG